MRPAREARISTWTRSRAPHFVKIWLRCDFTVPTDRCILKAISAFESPRPRASTISSSLEESVSLPRSGAWGREGDARMFSMSREITRGDRALSPA